MTPITIRPYRPEDIESLVALFQASVRVIARRHYTHSQVHAWAPDVIDHENFGRRCAAKSTWVAEYEGKVAGFSDLEPDGHIEMLYVHPEFQGRGVARALLANIEKVARERGLARLYTEASVMARPVFKKAGFRVVAPQTIRVRGESMTNYRMEKQWQTV